MSGADSPCPTSAQMEQLPWFLFYKSIRDDSSQKF